MSVRSIGSRPLDVEVTADVQVECHARQAVPMHSAQMKAIQETMVLLSR